MAAKRASFECSAVRETVSIRLGKRRVGGFNGHELPFVQCDQSECQYVDENEPPCPLSLELFSGELEKRKEQARIRREEAYQGY